MNVECIFKGIRDNIWKIVVWIVYVCLFLYLYKCGVFLGFIILFVQVEIVEINM